MCRSGQQPDGPKTCSADSRSEFADTSGAFAAAQTVDAELSSALAPDAGTKPLPANPKIKIPIPQTSDDPAVYVDPYPTMKGSDRVRVECHLCQGTGIYFGPSGISTSDPYVKNGTKKGHFECHGRGFKSIKVSSARAAARLRVKSYLKAQEDAKQRVAEREAARVAAAKKEEQRRADMVQGFIGQKGDKVGGLSGTVMTATSYETRYGYSRQSAKFLVIKLDNGQVVTTGGSGASLFGHERGDKVTIVSATVKDHDNYQGQDQTKLTRMNLIATPQPAHTS